MSEADLQPHQVKKYGWLPDFPDARDHIYSAPITSLGPLPASTDLSKTCPPVYDQGQLGSCTANAIGAAVQFDRMKQGVTPDFAPSRLFIYYNERVIEHTVGSDSGAQIRDGIKTVGKKGVCHETTWPYDISQFTHKPPAEAFTEALQAKALSYARVPRTLNQMKGCLASGFPFVLGFSVYESFESQQVAQTGKMPMPGPGEKLLGGHAVLAVGYDDADQTYLIRNSWGSGWGMGGYFKMPYAYLLDENLSDDFWTIRLIGS
jgi:C1A family cysteine protease